MIMIIESHNHLLQIKCAFVIGRQASPYHSLRPSQLPAEGESGARGSIVTRSRPVPYRRLHYGPSDRLTVVDLLI